MTHPTETQHPGYEAIWSALPLPVILLGTDGIIHDANPAAEAFVLTSVRQMRGQPLARYTGATSPVLEALEQARRGAQSVVLHDIEIGWADQDRGLVNVHAARLLDDPALVTLLLHPRGMAEKMDRSLSHRTAARSVTGMAAMLAHEIRNPLAGITGAAQLLAMNLPPEDQELTGLIEQEARRIGALVARVEEFGDLRPTERRAVNIHDVLDRARRAALAGFGRALTIVQDYDPSLPPVAGAADQLMQVFLNLLKNAAEAMAGRPGRVVLRSAYRPGVKLTLPGRQAQSLPIQISVADNGPGIPLDLRDDVFEPFVSTRASGTGLGLALVSKIVADHGGVVEYSTSGDGTEFRILLPVWRGRAEED